jgi:integrase
MAVFKRPDSENWWYQFVWRGKRIRESTKQTNKAVARQMEAVHRTALAKAEVGIRARKPIPTLKQFADADFLPFIESRFSDKRKTLEYYRNGLKNITGYGPLARCALDEITADKIGGFIATRRDAELAVGSINRELEVLRRMLKLAVEWGKVDRVLPKVEMLPGERHRERVLTQDEERRYLDACAVLGDSILEAYCRALEGIRATQRGEQPIKPEDPYLLRDVTTLLVDCGLRPDECFRLRWAEVRDGAVHVLFGKTDNARRVIPLPQRAAALLDMRRVAGIGEWVFPAPTSSGHIEKSSLKKQHRRACGLAQVEYFTLYTLRHTCLTRWAAYMDPYTLAYLAGHSDFSTTRRYVHPQAETVRAAMERARAASQGSHVFRHGDEKAAETPSASTAVSGNDLSGKNGRGEWIRTTDLLVPNQAL